MDTILDLSFMLQVFILPSNGTTWGPPEECRRQCIGEKHKVFDGHCPIPGTCSWHCAATRFELENGDCVGNRIYHCARNYTYLTVRHISLHGPFEFMEACAQEKVCPAGI